MLIIEYAVPFKKKPKYFIKKKNVILHPSFLVSKFKEEVLYKTTPVAPVHFRTLAKPYTKEPAIITKTPEVTITKPVKTTLFPEEFKKYLPYIALSGLALILLSRAH